MLSNKRFLDISPLITTTLLEGANVGQLIRMWTERTAEGQSILSWVLVSVALCLWLNWYIKVTPERKWAIWCTAFGIAMNAVVIFTVIWFRYIV